MRTPEKELITVVIAVSTYSMKSNVYDSILLSGFVYALLNDPSTIIQMTSGVLKQLLSKLESFSTGDKKRSSQEEPPETPKIKEKQREVPVLTVQLGDDKP